MATFDRREVTTRAVELVLPAPPGFGVCWVELYKAVAAAHQELATAGLIQGWADAPDDMILLIPGDKEIVVRYELPHRNEQEASRG